MRRLVYVSRAFETFSLDALMALLQSARRQNEQLGVTGVLFYESSSFLQFLEGEPAAVDGALRRVRADRRHEAVWVLCDEVSAAPRLFPQWRMGFHHMSAIEPLAPLGLVQNDAAELAAALARRRPGHLAGELLASFWAGNRHAFVTG